MEPLVLGLDIGGTASRALVTTLDGTRVGYGRAGAGNPVTVPLPVATANVSAALAEALSDVDPARIVAAVAGAAGSSGFQVLQPVFASLRCPVRVVGDVVVAFAAGTVEATGSVLIAGTGAVAAEIENFEMTRVSDGLGWLLGDLGSGFWLGREAAAATARALQSGRDAGSHLVGLVTAAIGESEADPFVITVHSQPPRDLARLAPLVTQAALEHDPLACSIVDEAARHLAATVAAIRPAGAGTPIVLSGSVVLTSLPVQHAVRHALESYWPAAQIHLAGPAEVGAAQLAARLCTGGVPHHVP